MGAYYDDTTANGAGSAYVYDVSSGSAVFQATIDNPSPEPSDSFGYSVSVSGDTVVVRAHNDNTGAPNPVTKNV